MPNGDVMPGKARYWRWFLGALWSLGLLMLVVGVADTFGLHGTPWFGYWDSVTVASRTPYFAKFVQVVPGGAAYRAGIRDGDRVDLRNLDAYRRFGLLFQPATRPIMLPVVRNGKRFDTTVVPTTQYEVSPGPKTLNIALNVAARLWLLLCALLLWLRRWDLREGRYLCLTLIAVAAGSNAVVLVTTNGPLDVLSSAAQQVFGVAAMLLPVALARGFGARTLWRSFFELLALLAAAAYLWGSLAAEIGVLTARIDPLPMLFGNGRFVAVAAYAAAAIAVSAAIASVPQTERTRAAWLLLPMPVSLALTSLAVQMTTTAPTYLGYIALYILATSAMLAGAAAVTYALLARRVIDLQFVIGRTLVVAGVSAIVVLAFTLLEWFLGTVMTNVSHATGLAANAALALVLGLSMSFIHKRVDRFVDLAFFRKRYEDERALRDFSKEAAFVTERDDLLDRTIETVARHTDARFGAILLDGEGTFRAARSFGENPPAASENDSLILALKARHEPLDPHRYATALPGDLALPILARGKLLGLLLLGARTGGEAYVADEIDAARELAHGVGSALDVLNRTDGERGYLSAILEELRALRATTERNAKLPPATQP